MTTLKVTERGWAAHFCNAKACMFKRNTLVEYNNKFIIISTVGDYRPHNNTEKINLNSYYETMVFHAKFDGTYYDANISKQIYDLDNQNIVSDFNYNMDKIANNNHDLIVEEIKNKLLLNLL